MLHSFFNRKKDMKIKAKNPGVSSMKLIVPFDGEISIDANGTAEVSAKCAVALVTGTNDWDYLKKTKASANETVEDDEEEEEDDNDEGGELSEREEFEAHLASLKFEELKALAEEGEMPVEEWSKLNSKKLLAAYLLKKFDETKVDEEE